MEDFSQFAKMIDDIFLQVQSSSSDFDTQSVLDKCKDFFDQHCAEGGDLDPRPTDIDIDGKAHLACRLYGYAAVNLIKLRRTYAAEDLLLHGWDKFNAIQREVRRKIYKGTIAIWLVILYQEVLNDIGAATHWALLTHADDALVGHFIGEGGQRLRYSFGMSENAMSGFNAIVTDQRLDRYTGDWSQGIGFADDILVKFALKFPQYAHLFSNPTSKLEFTLCIPYLESLLKQVNESRSNKQASDIGNSLEYLAAYLFLLVPGFIPHPKVIPKSRDFENDLVISNSRSSGNLEAELFGRDFLVECKNWTASVGVSEVGYFLYRMRLTHTKFGIIFAKKGITGKKKIEAAESLRQRAFHEDDSLCIVIDETDIHRILKKDTTFRSLLLEKTNDLRFGKQHNT